MFVKSRIKDLKTILFLCESNLEQVCFRTDLKCSRDDAFLKSAGELFHKVGSTTPNAQSPYDSSRDTGTWNSIQLDDPSFRDDFLMDPVHTGIQVPYH